MRIIFALLCSVVVASAQFAAQYRGEYLGIVQASSRCSNERWTVNIFVDNDGDFYGTLHDYDTVQTNYFKGDLTPQGKWSGLTSWDVTEPSFDPLSPLAGWKVKLSASARAGTIRGTIDGRSDGFCVYTFTAYRRFKVAQ
jgi:hypothetical protein